MAGRCHAMSRRSRGCPGSGRTPREPWPRSRSGRWSARWTRTSGGWSVGRSSAMRHRRPAGSRKRPTRRSTRRAPATGPTPSWTSARRSAGRGARIAPRARLSDGAASPPRRPDRPSPRRAGRPAAPTRHRPECRSLGRPAGCAAGSSTGSGRSTDRRSSRSRHRSVTTMRRRSVPPSRPSPATA